MPAHSSRGCTVLLLLLLFSISLLAGGQGDHEGEVRGLQSELDAIHETLMIGNANATAVAEASTVQLLHKINSLYTTIEDKLSERNWFSEQVLSLQASTVAVYAEIRLQVQVRQAVEEWNHNIYGMATGALHRAISLQAATVDAPSYGVISALSTKLKRLDTALGESVQQVPLTLAEERFNLPRLVVPGWEDDAHISPEGPLITAARQVTFPEGGPTWLGDTRSFRWTLRDGDDRSAARHGGGAGAGGGGSTEVLVDVAIPVHPKDAATVPVAVSQLRKHCTQIGTVFVVSSLPSAAPEGTVFVDEASFPFKPGSFHKETYQQFLKMLFVFVVPSARDNVLIMDSDVIWLRDVQFMGPSGQLLLSHGTFSNSWGSSRSYPEGGKGHAEAVASLIGQRRPATESDLGRHAVVHHMVVNRQVLRELFDHIAARASRALGRPIGWEPWMTFVELFDAHHTQRSQLYQMPADVGTLPPSIRYIDQLHETSEYELYDVFAFHTSRIARVERRNLLYADIGQCCFYQDGSAVEGCDMAAMASGLRKVFGLDYVACHTHMRLVQRNGKTLHDMLEEHDRKIAAKTSMDGESSVVA